MAARQTPGREDWLGVLFVTASAGAIWTLLAALTDLLIPDFLLELEVSGDVEQVRPGMRRFLVLTGLIGFAAAAVLSLSIRVVCARLGFAIPGWGILLLSLPLGAVVAAFTLPPDVVSQIVWLGLLLLAHGADLWRRSRRRDASCPFDRPINREKT